MFFYCARSTPDAFSASSLTSSRLFPHLTTIPYSFGTSLTLALPKVHLLAVTHRSIRQWLINLAPDLPLVSFLDHFLSVLFIYFSFIHFCVPLSTILSFLFIFSLILSYLMFQHSSDASTHRFLYCDMTVSIKPVN